MLDVRNVYKTFAPGTVNEKKVLKGLSLHMAPGDFATVIGSNGAGKTTLFNAIAGTFLTDEGQIFINGEDVTFRPETYRARVIGRIFQDTMMGTAPNMTIEQNLAIAYASTKKGLRPAITRADRAYFRETLARLNMGLEDRMKTKMGLLSGGQRQAITLLMAVIVTPDILLLDEHTAAHMFVDPMCRIMRGCLESGASIGLHTHEDSCEIVYCFSGSAKVIYDGQELRLSAGEAHYCPKGHSHTVINDTDGEMQFLAIVPQQ